MGTLGSMEKCRAEIALYEKQMSTGAHRKKKQPSILQIAGREIEKKIILPSSKVGSASSIVSEVYVSLPTGITFGHPTLLTKYTTPIPANILYIELATQLFCIILISTHIYAGIRRDMLKITA